jgi:hypothetical protein
MGQARGGGERRLGLERQLAQLGANRAKRVSSAQGTGVPRAGIVGAPAAPLSLVAPAAGSSTSPPIPPSSTTSGAPPKPPGKVAEPPADAPRPAPPLDGLAPPAPIAIEPEPELPPPLSPFPPVWLEPGRSGCGLSRQPTARAEQASQRQCRITEPMASSVSKNLATNQPRGRRWLFARGASPGKQR